MKEHTRIRLGKIVARFANRNAPEQGEAEREARFLHDFARACAEAIGPVMNEVGAALVEAGHGYRVVLVPEAQPRAIELRLSINGRTGHKDTIRFFVKNAQGHGFQVIGEVEIKRSAVEITRFAAPEELTGDVAEQLVVDAVEQIFASNEGPRPPTP